MLWAGRLTPAAVTGELLAALSVASPACVSALAAAVADVALRRGSSAGTAGGAHPLALALRAAPGAQAALLLALQRALDGPDGCAPPATKHAKHPR